ncbi:MAG: hypothetical protein QOH03_4683, partial [Kribbellaceae bacterium]|nr:hypothetical protein [Kribbellaceae bacterium]
MASDRLLQSVRQVSTMVDTCV